MHKVLQSVIRLIVQSQHHESEYIEEDEAEESESDAENLEREVDENMQEVFGNDRSDAENVTEEGPESESDLDMDI